MGDLGVAAPLVDDGEQPVNQPVSSATALNLGPRRRKYSNNEIPLLRPHLGKRKSFVGTVRVLLTPYCYHFDSHTVDSRVGWPLSSSKENVTTPRLIFGHLELLPLNSPKAARHGRVKVHRPSFSKRESHTIV